MCDVYRYAPLASARGIRLLSIRRTAQHYEPVRWELESASLDEPPAYIALSYVWGNPRKARDLIIGGRKLAVTENLFAALETWRSRLENSSADGSLKIWADAACINQTDIPERSQQVAMMGDIYRAARLVWVWLGKETENTRDTIDFTMFAFSELYAKEKDSKNSVNVSRLLTPADLTWAPFQAMLNFDWFSRKWVMQEIVLARDACVWIGAKMIPWRVLGAVAFRVAKDFSTDFMGELRLLKQRQGWGNLLSLLNYRMEYTQGPFDINDLLSDSKSFLATDPRDHLFAILGLTAQATQPLLRPDYSADLLTICKRYTEWHLRNRSLAFLYYIATYSLPRMAGFPSWIPQIDNYNGGHTQESLFRASRDRTVFGISADDATRLAVRGLQVDVIEELCYDWRQDLRVGEGFDSSRNQIKPIIQECKRVAFPNGYHGSADNNMAFWRALICEKGYPNSRTRASHARLERVAEFVNFFDREEAPKMLSDLPSDQASRFDGIFPLIDRGLRFCRTAAGRLGQVQPGSQPGDIICVFFGANLPFVMRRRCDGYYTFFGPCYVHGIMDGEALNLGLEEQQFVLV